jgi:hypothetical protein
MECKSKYFSEHSPNYRTVNHNGHIRHGIGNVYRKWDMFYIDLYVFINDYITKYRFINTSISCSGRINYELTDECIRRSLEYYTNKCGYDISKWSCNRSVTRHRNGYLYFDRIMYGDKN